MSLRNMFSLLAVATLMLVMTGCQPKPETQIYINLMIDAEQDDAQGLTNITDELMSRNIKATVYATADFANTKALVLEDIYSEGFEIGLHGYHTGEQLATMTYAEQKDLLTRAQEALEGCLDCGTNKPVVGFKPQYYSLNEDTLAILDELGIQYISDILPGNAPFQNYAETNVPFTIEGHSLCAVPITVEPFNGKTIHLCDIACGLGYKMTPNQWLEALKTAAQEAAQNNTPLVVNFHGWYTGDKEQYNYWEPFIDFLDTFEGTAAFVTTSELVKMFNK